MNVNRITVTCQRLGRAERFIFTSQQFLFKTAHEIVNDFRLRRYFLCKVPTHADLHRVPGSQCSQRALLDQLKEAKLSSEHTALNSPDSEIKHLTVKKSTLSLPSIQKIGMPTFLFNPCRGILHMGIGNEVQKHKNRERASVLFSVQKEPRRAGQTGSTSVSVTTGGQALQSASLGLGLFQSGKLRVKAKSRVNHFNS